MPASDPSRPEAAHRPPAALATIAGPSPLRQWIFLILLSLIWGSTWVVIKIGFDEGLPVFTSGALRFTVAALAMIPVAWVFSRREAALAPSWPLSLAMGLCHFGGSYAIVYWSESQLPSSLVAVLWASYPFFLGLLGVRFLPAERFTLARALGLLVGFGGVALLFRADLSQLGPDSLMPALVLLLSPLIVAIGTVFVKRGGADQSALLMTRNGLAIGAIMLWAVALAVEGPQPLAFSAQAWATILYLSLAGTVLAFSLYFWLLRFAPASRLATITFLTPPIALCCGAVWRSEPVTLTTLLGTALILIGIAIEKGLFRRR